MANVCMIGLDAQELPWVRLLVTLLRNPDPVVRAITREALGYLEGVAERTEESRAAS